MATVAIEAGRELDALVAVEVMGWRWHDDRMGTLWRSPSDLEWRAEPPAYSTTGDGMLAVLERMRELGWSVNIESPWQVVFDKVTLNGFVAESASAATLPHAVCLAALEAVRA